MIATKKPVDLSEVSEPQPQRPRLDARRYVDRRESSDRRNTIRFEDDRRQFIRREEDRAWRLT